MTTRQEALDQYWKEAQKDLVSASRSVGIDSGIVVKIAGFESGFDSQARPVARNAARNTVRQFDGVMAISSAYGYGQFIDSTWAETLREHGGKYGVRDASSFTNKQANEPQLRNNPELQAAMLAESTRENMLKGARLGGPDPDANVYAFHNLGDRDATKFLNALRQDSASRADAILPAAVIKGNPALYGDGSRSIADAYVVMGRHMDQYERYAMGVVRDAYPNQALTPRHPEREREVESESRHGVAKSTILELGDQSREVRELQTKLRALGYGDAETRSLSVDGDFGDRTKQAVEAFQRAHGLALVDGVVGAKTMEALRIAGQVPLLSNPSHPDNAMYQQALRGLQQLPSGSFRSDTERSNAAATLTFEAKVSGMRQIDHVVLSSNGSGLFAVQGRLDDPAHGRIYVNRAQAAAQPLERSSEQLRQDAASQQQAQVQSQVQVQQQQVEYRGVTLGIRP